MAILSRFAPKGVTNVQDLHILPASLYALFEKAPSFGTIYDRRKLYDHVLPLFEEFHKEHAGLVYSIRPAWMSYNPSPISHVIVTGHILFCHAFPDLNWYYQPSLHLFREDAMYRAEEVRRLTKRALSRCRPHV